MDFESLRRAFLDASPSERAIGALGISETAAKEFLSSFRLIPRTQRISITGPSDLVSDFFGLYDPSHLEIGMVRFAFAPTVASMGRMIGQVESDPIIVSDATNLVHVDDLYASGNTLWECAQSMEHFLLALVPAATYLGICLVDETAVGNQSLQHRFLDQCVSEAGGEHYSDFYKMLLGVEF